MKSLHQKDIFFQSIYITKKCALKFGHLKLNNLKKNNPHIKNPDVILVNQKIKVQDCRVKIQEVAKEKLEDYKPVEEVKEKPEWFLGVFGGASLVGAKKDDTSKSGYNLGVKVGRKFTVDNKKVSLAVGYMFNQLRTRDDNNSLGVYEISTDMFTLEGSMLYSVSKKIELGPKLMIVTGKDVSLTEKELQKSFGAYAGVEGLYKLSHKMDLELSIQHRLDDLSRVNAMGNIGLRLSF